MTKAPSFYQRYLLPGLAFKAVVIGGGYATGRELIEFFMPAGPLGGVFGMLLAMVIWSAVCIVSFALAHRLSAYDYRALLTAVLGPAWRLFEISYFLFLVLVLAVVSAAAGEIGAATFGLPRLVGTLLLMASVATATSFGNDGVEGMFRYTSSILYAVYAIFLVLAVNKFGDLIPAQFASGASMKGWAAGGVSYASYNVVAMIAVLPFIRHITKTRDAVIAGALAGPLAMLPALIFFASMMAFYPQIGAETLPSDFLLKRLNAPWFQILFQVMIFCALLETGVGAVNALNARIEGALVNRGGYSLKARFMVGAILLLGSGFAAVKFGLVTLIAKGYGALAYIMLAILVAPIMTVGLWKLIKRERSPSADRDGKEIKA
ncbi:MAG: hypothetical protein AAB227_11595 [Pseudomonadota bacterium]